MKIYKTQSRALPGSQYAEIYNKAFGLYKQIKSKTKRRPYIRSAYFKKDKIFLELFWHHLHQKNWHDRTRRIKYLPCALELIKYSRLDPESKENPKYHSQILYRFSGMTPDGVIFKVQIKEDRPSGQKWLMSIFPID